MPAVWQKWMPIYIQRLKSNPYVIAMHPSARAGYLWLFMEQWQSEDCTLPNNSKELRVLSCMGAEWEAHGDEILDRFTTLDGDRLRNDTCYELWMEAKAKYEEGQKQYEYLRQIRSAVGRRGAKAKAEKASTKQTSSKPQAIAKQMTSKPEANSSLTVTDTYTNTEKQKPSGDKRQPDARHTPFRFEIQATYENPEYGGEFVWDASEAKALSNLLGANPKLTLEGFRRLMGHRANSEAVNLAQRPRAWLERITDYASGPLDRFNKLKGARDGTGKSTGSAGRVQRSLDAWDRAAERRGVSGTESATQANAGLLPPPGIHAGDGRGIPVRHGEISGEIRAGSSSAGVVRPTAPSGPEILPPPGASLGGVRGYGGNSVGK